MSTEKRKPLIVMQEVSLRSVLRYYAEGFQPGDGNEIIEVMDCFCDTSKDTVIFKLLVSPKTETGEEEE